MEPGTWMPAAEDGLALPAPDRSGVHWRRVGRSAELSFAQPSRTRMWQKRWIPARALPAVTGVLWGLGAAVVGAGVGTIGVVTGFTGIPWLVGAGIAFGVLAPPAGAFVGVMRGRRLRRDLESRDEAKHRIDIALRQAYGESLDAEQRLEIAEQAALTMRRGVPSSVSMWTSGTEERSHIEPVDERTVRIVPVVPAERDSDAANGVAELIGSVTRELLPASWSQFAGLDRIGKRSSGVTAASDRRMEALQGRLDGIVAAGRIDRNSANYPALVLLREDRITEYRRLSARANAIARIGTPAADAAAKELSADLLRTVEVLEHEVDALEHDVLDEAARESDAHMIFLREKYGRS